MQPFPLLKGIIYERKFYTNMKEGVFMKKVYCFVAVMCVIALMISAFNAPSSESPALADVNTPLEQLEAMEIVEGFEDGELHGEATLTRAQFAKILTNTFTDAYMSNKKLDFSDITSTHWAYKHIQEAANAGWLEGFEDGTFRPDEEITYEQALTIMCRVLDIVYGNANYPADYISAAI